MFEFYYKKHFANTKKNESQNTGPFCWCLMLSPCLPAAAAEHQAPLVEFPPILTTHVAWTRPRPRHLRARPSCCASSGPRSPSSCSSCSSLASPAWCPWPSRTTAAITPTTLPAPFIPCCATPTDLHPYEKQLDLHLQLLPRTQLNPVNVFSSPSCPEATNSLLF